MLDQQVGEGVSPTLDVEWSVAHYYYIVFNYCGVAGGCGDKRIGLWKIVASGVHGGISFFITSRCHPVNEFSKRLFG